MWTYLNIFTYNNHEVERIWNAIRFHHLSDGMLKVPYSICSRMTIIDYYCLYPKISGYQPPCFTMFFSHPHVKLCQSFPATLHPRHILSDERGNVGTLQMQGILLATKRAVMTKHWDIKPQTHGDWSSKLRDLYWIYSWFIVGIDDFSKMETQKKNTWGHIPVSRCWVNNHVKYISG